MRCDWNCLTYAAVENGHVLQLLVSFSYLRSQLFIFLCVGLVSIRYVSRAFRNSSAMCTPAAAGVVATKLLSKSSAVLLPSDRHLQFCTAALPPRHVAIRMIEYAELFLAATAMDQNQHVSCGASYSLHEFGDRQHICGNRLELHVAFKRRSGWQKSVYTCAFCDRE